MGHSPKQHPVKSGDTDTGVSALYSRVTREESVQKGLSLSNQKRRFEELAKIHGWENIKVYAEPKGLSGELPPEQRPALSALVEDARAGKISRVVVRHLDRLGRGDVLVPVLQILQSADIEVMTFDGTVEVKSAAGRFVTRIQAAAGAFEVERGGERIREAKRGRAHDGIYIGPAPFGYTNQSRKCRELITSGLSPDEARSKAQREIPVSPGLIIDEAEAHIVREVFDLYVNKRIGARAIAKELNSRGLLRRGKPWVSQNVGKLLRDPKLAGFITYDEKAYSTGSKNKAPIHKQTRYPGKHEGIIDPDLFRKAEILLNEGRKRAVLAQNRARIYPLTPVLHDLHGHRMKGSATGKHAYYCCHIRRKIGPNSDLGGCDAKPIPAERIENAVRTMLTELFSSPEVVLQAWETAKQKMSEEAPERKRLLSKHDMEIAGLERERESAFSGLRDVDLQPEQYQVIADRAKELNDKIRKAHELRDEIEQKIVPIQVKRLSKEQVKIHLSDLKSHLSNDPARFRDIIILLKSHHSLQITAFDNHRFHVSMTMHPASIRGDSGQAVKVSADVEPVIDLDHDGEMGLRTLTNEEWADRENEKGHYCQCGCGQKIKVLPRHRASTKGIPKFCQGSGHWKMSTTEYVERLNSEGYLTISQAAKELGIGGNTLRRAEEKGWIKPDWRQWGKRYPMRVYKKENIPKLRESLVSAGFRFRDDDSLLTTREAAKALGIAESTLRRHERLGHIPTQPRDTAGRRMWKKSDLAELRKLIKGYKC